MGVHQAGGGSDTQLVMRSAAAFGSKHPELAFQALLHRLRPGEQLVWEGEGRDAVRIKLPIRMQLRGGRTTFTGPTGESVFTSASPRVDPALLRLLRAAHHQQQELQASPAVLASELRDPRPGVSSYHRHLGRLAFLAPDLQRALMEGRLPPTVTAQRLMMDYLPLAWADQRRWLGVAEEA